MWGQKVWDTVDVTVLRGNGAVLGIDPGGARHAWHRLGKLQEASFVQGLQRLLRLCLGTVWRAATVFEDSRVCILREIAWYVPITAMGGQATASFIKSRRINSAPILLAFVVCIDDYVNSGLLHKTIYSFLRTIPLCTATTLQRLLRQRQVATSPRGQRAVLRFSSGSLYIHGGES
mgnify:CR=1 FL=1